MSKISLALAAILTLSMAIILAPNIFAINRGKVLRNVAIWLAIFVALGLIYQNFGPDSKMPLFHNPVFIRGAAINQQPSNPQPQQ